MQTVEVLVPPNNPPRIATGYSGGAKDLGDRIANLKLKDVVQLLRYLSLKN